MQSPTQSTVSGDQTLSSEKQQSSPDSEEKLSLEPSSGSQSKQPSLPSVTSTISTQVSLQCSKIYKSIGSLKVQYNASHIIIDID